MDNSVCSFIYINLCKRYAVLFIINCGFDISLKLCYCAHLHNSLRIFICCDIYCSMGIIYLRSVTIKLFHYITSYVAW